MSPVILQTLIVCSVIMAVAGFSSLRRQKKEKSMRAMGQLISSDFDENKKNKISILDKGLIITAQAGYNFSLFTLLLSVLGIVAFCFVLGVVIFGKASVALGASPIGLVLARFYLSNKTSQRADELALQMEDWLTTLCSNIQAGLTLAQAILSVTPRLKGLIRQEMDNVVHSIKMGSTALQALESVAHRIPAVEYKMVLTAVELNEKLGGNLVKSFDDIIKTIRSRREDKNKVKSMAVQGKMASTVIGLIPLGLIFIFRLLSPGYMNTLYEHPIGQVIFIVTLCMAVLGWWKIRTMGNIKTAKEGW